MPNNPKNGKNERSHRLVISHLSAEEEEKCHRLVIAPPPSLK